MATYGVNPTPGQVAWTGYSNTLGYGPANAGVTSGYVAFNGVQQGDDRLAKMFRNGGMTIGTTQILLTLLGTAVGGTATKNHVWVQGPSTAGSPQGAPNGLITAQTVPLVNRATNANDLAAFQALLTRFPYPSVYAPDISGNGGGGKQQLAGGGSAY
jgi:hypothetical protein